MDRDTPAPRDVPDHLVTRHGLAATRIPHHQVVHALNSDAAPRNPETGGELGKGGWLDLRSLYGIMVRMVLLDDGGRTDVAAP